MFESPSRSLQPAFSRGEVSNQLFGRVDLAAYVSSLATCLNFFVRAEGGISNRQGTQWLGSAINNTAYGSVLIPFVFSTSQAYVLEFAAGSISVYGQGALVATGIATPYALADLANLRYTQSNDTLTIVHPSYPPYELKRTAPTTFTFAQAVYINGPFLDQNTDGVTFVYASGVTGIVNLIANADIFKPGHIGALFQLTEQDLSPVAPWEPSKVNPGQNGLPGSPGEEGALRRSNGKNYKRVADFGGANCQTGSWAPNHTQGTVADGDGYVLPGGSATAGIYWQYQDSGFGIVKITAYTDARHVTGVVQPNYVGGPGLLPVNVVGGPVTSFGPYTFSGDGSTKTFTPISDTTAVTDPGRFYVTVNGAYQSPSTYGITAANPGSIVFLNAPASGTNNIVVRQINGLNQTTYWAFGAFSLDQGYPSTVTYYPDRIVLANTPSKPVSLWGSKSSSYHDFGVTVPQVASDALTATLNARQLNSINDLIPLSDLIVGTSNIVWRLWPGSTGTALSPLALAASPQNYYGEANVPAVLYGESAIFVQQGGRKIRDLIYQFQFDKFVGSELTLEARHLFPFGTSVRKLAYAPEPFGQLFALRTDGTLCVLTYVRDQNVVGWSRYTTNGTYEDIVVIPENGTFTAYVLVNRANGRFIERFANREFASIEDAFFVDCGLTYDGRNSSSVTMALSGASGFLAGGTATLKASSASGWSGFASSNVANLDEMWLFDASGNRVRCLITAYTSPTQCTVSFKDPVPAALQSASTVVWTFAKTAFLGATALANQALAVLADGNVIAGITCSNSGTFTLPNACGVVQAGLSYNADAQALPLNLQGQEPIRNRSKKIPQIGLDVTETRHYLAGSNFVNMRPYSQRKREPYTSPTALQEGNTQTYIDAVTDDECVWCVRQDKPLPITIRGVIAEIAVGENG